MDTKIIRIQTSTHQLTWARAIINGLLSNDNPDLNQLMYTQIINSNKKILTNCPTRAFIYFYILFQQKLKIILFIYFYILLQKQTTMQLFIKTGTGSTYTIETESVDITVKHFKRKIEASHDVPVHQQRLIYGGNQLENDRTLAYYGIEKEVTIHLILRLRGD